jgi:alpha-tubulin suppressor-like RCC1 family protein
MIAAAISAGTGTACALVSDGSVWCWGANNRGELGDGTTTDSDVPVRVKGVSRALTVQVGGTWNQGGQGAAKPSFACAVLGDDSVKCWGQYPGGQPGTNDPSLAGVSGGGFALGVATGNWHACMLASGSVACWGDNRWGQLGIGGICDRSGCTSPVTDPATPVIVEGISGAIAVSGKGSDFSCAVVSAGSVECWGIRYGGGLPQPLPVVIPGVSTTGRGLAAGYRHACAVSSPDGKVQCWGNNDEGELGDGTSTSSDSPVSVIGLRSAAVTVAAGSGASCALLKVDGTIQCWGNRRPGPVTVPGISDASAVSAGYGQTCALTKAGRVLCWGSSEGAEPAVVSGF